MQAEVLAAAATRRRRGAPSRRGIDRLRESGPAKVVAAEEQRYLRGAAAPRRAFARDRLAGGTT